MDDILASIRKIIADDFSISGGTKSYNSEERLGGDPGDDSENSDSDVLDLGKPSPLVHSLSGASSRQVESDSAPLTGLRRDVSEVPSLRRPNVTQLRSASEEENTEYAQRPVLSQVTDRNVRSVSERLSTLHPSSKLESQDPSRICRMFRGRQRSSRGRLRHRQRSNQSLWMHSNRCFANGLTPTCLVLSRSW
jgi:hypothetical protein